MTARRKATRSRSRRGLAETVEALGELGTAIDLLDGRLDRLRESVARCVLHRIGSDDARSIHEIASTLTMVTSIVRAIEGALSEAN